MTDIDDAIRKILTTVRTVAIVGASDKPERAAHGVMKFLQDKGYRCIPVNPRLAGQTLLGETVYTALADIPEHVDMVDVFRRPQDTVPIADDAVQIGADVLWMQLGVVNEEAARRAIVGGLDVIMDRCPAIEIPRLGL